MERLYDWFPLLSARLTTAFSKLLTCILPNLRQKNCYPGSAGIKSASFTVILVHCFYFLFSSWRTPFPLPVILESRLFSHCHPGARWKRAKYLRAGGLPPVRVAFLPSLRCFGLANRGLQHDTTAASLRQDTIPITGL